MKIDLMDWDGKRSHAFYENFRITNETVRQTLLFLHPPHYVAVMMTKCDILLLYPTSQDKYRLYYEMYSGKAGDALAGGGGMVEQWSASLSGMQFSTRDQVLYTLLAAGQP